MRLPQQLVGPRDCSLLVGIPLTREQFFGDLARPDEKGYALHIKAINQQENADDEYYWNSIYGPIADVMLGICNEVEALGVTVKRAARLIDLTRCLEEFKVVSVVAHLSLKRFRADNILDPRSLLEALRSPQNRVQYSLQEAFRRRAPEMLSAITRINTAALREHISEILNTIVAEASTLYERDRGNAGVPELASERLTRVALEEALPGLIAAGGVVELRDDCHSVRAVIDAVPIAFSGLIDLTMCNSVILGDALKQKRPNCLVAVNRYPTEAHIRFILYKLIIKELSRRPTAFMDVITKIHIRPDRKGTTLWRLFVEFFRNTQESP